MKETSGTTVRWHPSHLMQMNFDAEFGRGLRTTQSRRPARACLTLIFSISGFMPAYCQQSDSATNAPPQPEAKRIFWIIPNLRTSPVRVPHWLITTAERVHIARLDSFDRATFTLGALFGAEAQLTKANPSFGQGVPTYANYFATAYANYAIGDYLTEAIFPVILRQDPQYFRRIVGGFWPRLSNAAGQFSGPTETPARDSSLFSEIAGNSTAVAISMAYYPDNRTALGAVSKLGSQLGVDMASNILKVFA